MSDKRRRPRVQGGWGSAISTNKKKECKKNDNGGDHSMSPNPIDSFIYNPTIEIKAKPTDLIYQESGCYCLSRSKNGVSDIELCYNFIEPEECEWIFEDLKTNIPWRQEHVVIKGEQRIQPRLTAWFGDMKYSYSGLTHLPYPFTPLLTMLREKIENKTGVLFNAAFVNLYRNEKDSIAWHSDSDRSLGENPFIASLTFGDLRYFEMRQRPLEGDLQDFTYSQLVRVPLTSGCLLIMKGATQKDWQHRVPKEYHDHGERINLTFRQMNMTDDITDVPTEFVMPS